MIYGYLILRPLEITTIFYKDPNFLNYNFKGYGLMNYKNTSSVIGLLISEESGNVEE